MGLKIRMGFKFEGLKREHKRFQRIQERRLKRKAKSDRLDWR